MPRVNAQNLRVESGGSLVTHLRSVGTLAGVQVTHVAGLNGSGRGRLRCDGAGNLQWQAPGSSTLGTAVDASAGGAFFLEDGASPDKWVRVNVSAAALPSVVASCGVQLSETFANAVAPADLAAASSPSNWTFTVKNYSAGTITNITAFLAPDEPENRELQIKWAAGAFASPFNEADALASNIGANSLASGASATITVRRALVGAASFLRRVRIVLTYDDGVGGRGTVEARGGYRVFDAAASFECYGKTGSAPVPGVDTPIASAAALPITPLTTFGNGAHHLALVRVNRFGLRGGPQRIVRRDVSAGAIVDSPPNPPDSVVLKPMPDGKVRVYAKYARPALSEMRANQWAIWYTSDGSNPNTAAAPSFTKTMSFVSGAGYVLLALDDIPAQADGVTVTVAVKTRKSSSATASETAVQSARVIRTVGPGVPVGGGIGAGV